MLKLIAEGAGFLLPERRTQKYQAAKPLLFANALRTTRSTSAEGERAGYGWEAVTSWCEAAFSGASEATIASKRGSSRSGSQSGLRRKWP
jgi:hypothetical protein